MAFLVGLDLGSHCTRIWTSKMEQGEYSTYPTVIAINSHTDQVEAVGEQARAMIGKAPKGVTVCRPIQNGVFSNRAEASRMLAEYFDNEHACTIFQRPQVVFSTPYDTKDSEIQYIERVLLEDLGAKSVARVPSVLAAAVGAGLISPRAKGDALMLLLGADVSEMALISRNTLVNVRRCPVSGNSLNAAIIAYVKKYHGLVINDALAEQLKRKIGTLAYGDGRGAMVAKGKDIRTGTSRSVKFTSKDMYEAMKPAIHVIERTMEELLNSCSPSMAHNVSRQGLLLVGGGAKMAGLAPALSHKARIRVLTHRNPSACVINGLAYIAQYHEALGINLEYRKLGLLPF